MKKLVIILLFAGIAFSASAQRHGGGGFHGGGYYHGGFYGPRVSFGIGYPYFYDPYYPYYYPPAYYYDYDGHPSKLYLQIQDIKNDYEQRIWEAKHDKSVSRKERKRHVRELKHDEDQAIINAQRNYHNNDDNK